MIRFTRDKRNEDSKRPNSPIVYMILLFSFIMMMITDIVIKNHFLNMLLEGIFLVAFIFCILYILAKLINKVKVPSKEDGGYREEFVEFHEDHIKICSMTQAVAKQKYNFAEIYYNDILYTYINSQYLEIFLVAKPSQRTVISNASRRNNHFRMFIMPYPKELIASLKNDFKMQMKVGKKRCFFCIY